MFRTLAAATALTALPLTALADEVWSLPSGNQIVYDRDSGDTAIFSYIPEQGLDKGWIFVPGLTGAEVRGTYQGYWVESVEAGPGCTAGLTDAEGKTWARWGAMEVKFVKPGFPSAIKLKRGSCFGEAKQKITAKPVVGAGIQ
jgi:hypothetical protein